MALVPAVVLALVEGGLRLVGYGHPTSFFLERTIAGRSVLVQNDSFALRFFPPALLRRPLPLAMDAQKGTNAFRLFVFGESAAMGDPDPAFGFARILEKLLQLRFPNTKFEIVNVAFTAVNSHAMLPIARECAKLEGDLWIVYMGNNELEGPFGAGALFGPSAPPLPLVRASLALRSTRVGQLFAAAARQIPGREATHETWQGLGMLLDHPIAPDDPARERVQRNFAANLEDLLSAGRKAGVPILLSTVASNLRDAAPFASKHASPLDASRLAAFNKAFDEGIALETSGKTAEAAAKYAHAVAQDGLFAEAHFRLARCQALLGLTAEPVQSYIRARDTDALPLRADSRVNETIRRLATGREGVALVDAERELGSASALGVPGIESFFEHVHLTYEGNDRLARLFAERILPLLPRTVLTGDRGAWPSSETCATALGWTPWSEHAVWESMWRRIAAAPFTNQISHQTTARAYGEKFASVAARKNPSALQSHLERTQSASSRSPFDPFLRTQLARLQEASGQLPEAFKSWEVIRELLPHAASPRFELGRLAIRLGRLDEARAHLEEADRLRPGSPEILLEQGRASMLAGNPAQAISLLSSATRLFPDFADGLVLLGAARERAGQTNEALQVFLRLLESHPQHVSARLEAARILALSQRYAEAAEHYRNAVALQPANAKIRLNLADALAKAGRRGEARIVLEEAVRANPQLWEARYLLGVEFAMLEKVKEAESEFTEVVLLKPDFALAHLNLGVALAQQNRFDEALPRFQETLRLDPQNNQARQYLKMIAARKSSGP